MFRVLWLIGINKTYFDHSDIITTVKFGKGLMETEWKKLFSIRSYGFYYKGKTNEKVY